MRHQEVAAWPFRRLLHMEVAVFHALPVVTQKKKAVRFHDSHIMSSENSLRDYLTSGTVWGLQFNGGNSVQLSGQNHHCEKEIEG